MEAAANTNLTGPLAPIETVADVGGFAEGVGRSGSSRALRLGFLDPLTASTSSGSILLETSIWRPLNQPTTPARPPALRRATTYLIMPAAEAKLLADKTLELAMTSARLTLSQCDVVSIAPSSEKVSMPLVHAFRRSVVRATPDILAEYTSGERIFDAVQALYLSHNTPRDRRIAQRLTTVYRTALEEDEAVRPDSVAQFKNFFLANPQLGLPKITLSPEGALRARWIHGLGDFIALEFVGGRNAKLIAEIPREDGTAKYFGSEALENIVAVAQGMGATFA